MRISLLLLIIGLSLAGCGRPEFPISVSPPLFKEGDVVMFKADTNKVGIVTFITRWRDDPYHSYSVKFSIPAHTDWWNGTKSFSYSTCSEYELVLKK